MHRATASNRAYLRSFWFPSNITYPPKPCLLHIFLDRCRHESGMHSSNRWRQRFQWYVFQLFSTAKHVCNVCQKPFTLSCRMGRLVVSLVELLKNLQSADGV